MMDSSARVVLVHDWLLGMRGGEKCLEHLCRRWPDADIYTLLYQKGSTSSAIERCRIHTSFLQHLPGVRHYYRYLLPIMPQAAHWRIPPCDLLVSLSHCVAKSVPAPVGVPHVCYCFTPMRYAWHLRDSYFSAERTSGLKAGLIRFLLARLRDWDRRTSSHVTHFIAISQTIQARIKECYARDSIVIYPPVDTWFYTPTGERREDYYLVVSAFAPYKRVDLAIQACTALGKRLLIIGTGQDRRRLERMASTNVTFLGWQSNETIRDHLRRCRALLFPGEEDFGIVPVEAQACGTPVIALGKGGATETVIPIGESAEPTGVWFGEQTSESLMGAMEAFECNQSAFDPRHARNQALRFSADRFERELFAYLDQVREKPLVQPPLKRAA